MEQLFPIEKFPEILTEISGFFSKWKAPFIHKMALRCDGSAVTGDFLGELLNFHMDTFSKLEEHSGRFAEVSESDVEKFIEGEENANTKKKTFYDLNLVKTFLLENCHESREIEKIPTTELDSYLSQFV